MRAAVYTRISRDASGEGLGVERQRVDCVKLCEARGWDVSEVYSDNDLSATTGKPRPAYLRMLKAAEAGEVDIIVSWAVDRITRRLVELEHLIDMSERTGVKVATVSGDLDLTQPAGRLNARILASVARGEVEAKSLRQRRAGLQRAEDGRPPMRRAYGYTADGALLEPEAGIVREMYDRVLTGSTLVGLARWLNDRGSVNTRGGPWQRNAVRSLLLNPRYKGTRVYRGVEVGPGRWSPLVSEETWQAARARLTDPDRVSNRAGTARKWLGSGLYLCGKCPADDRSDLRVNYRDGGLRVYRCRRHLHMARAAEPVDELVEAVIVARLRRPDLADLLAARDETAGPSVLDLRREAEALRQRVDSLGVELAEGVLTARQVQVATRRLQDKQRTVEAQLVEAGQRSALDAVLGHPDPGTAWLDADLQRQRAVVDALVTVVLLPGATGRHGIDPESVSFQWKAVRDEA